MRSDVVVTGAASLACVARAPLRPARWAAAPAKLARMDRLCGLGLVACDGALLDAALQPSDASAWNGDRTAVVLGTAFGCHQTNEDYYRGFLKEGAQGASPRLFAYTLPSSPVGEISIHYGIRGPAAAVAPGLTAGLAALEAALRELVSGRADRVLAAAAEVATPLLERLLAREGVAPSLFDGAAALVLERTGGAAARGAAPRGRILATATTHAPGARARAVDEAARRALHAADLGPGAIGAVYACAEDAEAVRALGITAPAREEGAGTLGAAPLIACARRLLGGGDGIALVLAGDPDGTAAAALIA